jgi:hypothetical protein
MLMLMLMFNAVQEQREAQVEGPHTDLRWDAL